jgi:hypothetical protein
MSMRRDHADTRIILVNNAEQSVVISALLSICVGVSMGSLECLMPAELTKA